MTDPTDREWIVAPSETLALDFANTRYWRGTVAPSDSLASFDDVIRWCRDQAGLPAAAAAALEDWAAAHAGEAVEAFAAALVLRETVYRLFHAAAQGTAAEADLARLNRALQAAPARRSLAATEAGFGWQLATAGPAAAAELMTPVLWSAGDLLASRRLHKVRYCANPQCEWLFLDDSKSGNRRWCAMSACGNRAKAHRHYARRKETQP